ncbi:MAG: hypothetical protein JWO58_1411 [Chitinophagaceae bacterium]|nr:hypothetical protein [Chitinophagaceae bacterium]
MNNIKTNGLFLALIALIFTAYFFVLFYTPLDLFNWLSHHYNLGDNNVEILQQYINFFVWQKIKIVLFFCLLFLTYVYFMDRHFFSAYKKSFHLLYHALRDEFIDTSRKEKYILLVGSCLFSCMGVYYSSITPMQLDELDSWMFFVNRGLFVTAAYYPSNNNHIAFNLCSIVWNQFLSPLWAIRMVSIMSAVGVVVLFYVILRKKYNEPIVWMGMLLLMTSAPFVWYAVQGRGYELELLGLMFILFVLLNIKHDVYTDRLLILFNVFTVYVVPVALIPLALLNACYFYTLYIQKEEIVKRSFAIALYSIVFTLVVYAPVWIFSGFDHLLNNPFVQRVSYLETPYMALFIYAPQLWNFITGCEDALGGSILLGILIAVAVLWIKNERRVFIPLAVLCFPLLLLLVYPVLLFERTWLWLVIPYVLVWMEVFSLFIRRRSILNYLVMGTIVLLITWANGLRLYETNKNLVRNAEQISNTRDYLSAHFKNKKIRVCNDALYDYLRFDQVQGKGKYVLLTCAQGTTERADVVVDTRDRYKTAKGVLIWSNQQDVLYLPK